MNIKNRNIFFKDFIQPVVIPILAIGILIYLMYRGSKYYSLNIKDDLETELTKLGKLTVTGKIKENDPIPFLDYFKTKEDFHYKSILTISVVEIINEGIILILLVLFLLGFSSLIKSTYKYQIIILMMLLYLKTIVSLAMPNIQTSILEYFYLYFITNNKYHLLFNQLNMVAIAMSIAFIYTSNFIFFGKPITLSKWHQLTLIIVLTYKITKDIYNYRESVKNINEPRTIDSLRYLIKSINKYAANVSNELLGDLIGTKSIINNVVSQVPNIDINQLPGLSNVKTQIPNIDFSKLPSLNNVKTQIPNIDFSKLPNLNINQISNMLPQNNNTVSTNTVMSNDINNKINNKIESEIMTSEQLNYLKKQTINMFN
jgi:hypothetical protein